MELAILGPTFDEIVMKHSTNLGTEYAEPPSCIVQL